MSHKKWQICALSWLHILFFYFRYFKTFPDISVKTALLPLRSPHCWLLAQCREADAAALLTTSYYGNESLNCIIYVIIYVCIIYNLLLWQ